ncbi:hypothetical protein F0562_028078 [Nyssa sinensis]|uniref:Uncharacterized protein n=1 Tax=Nyssa sinensis TaxID=561372 RepID=A0A5J5B7S9_9ASTE|nr:hypothetical protein F0562_028078 [Nyssa sinensis]
MSEPSNGGVTNNSGTTRDPGGRGKSGSGQGAAAPSRERSMLLFDSFRARYPLSLPCPPASPPVHRRRDRSAHHPSAPGLKPTVRWIGANGAVCGVSAKFKPPWRRWLPRAARRRRSDPGGVAAEAGYRKPVEEQGEATRRYRRRRLIW